VLATLSDGEDTIAAAFQSCWPEAPHQRCQMHFLGNLAQEVLKEDDLLRQNLRSDLGGLPAVPKQSAGEGKAPLF
jgi:transposase-like protein